jgi:thiosulfate/3-mercaptopyruvate sulfurtransferase
MANFTTLVTLEAVQQHLGQPDWAIVDCRTDLTDPDWGPSIYRQAHIPGAVHADLETDLSASRNGRNGRHPLPAPQHLADVFSRWGIDDSVQVVAYDDGPDFYAARLWWSLRYLGHSAAAVLDGGFAAWKSAGLPIVAGDETRSSRTYHQRPHPESLVEASRVLASTRLLDARQPERYRGEIEPLDRVPGHIPGARNYEWRRSFGPDGRMLPPAVLRANLERMLGGVPSSDTVVYCGSGVSACSVLLAMSVAGLEGARLYPGSWSEWCSDPSRPVATGDEAPPTAGTSLA